MNWARILGRWTMRSIHGAILGAALLGAVNACPAQGPGGAANASVGKNYSKSLTFDLPVRIEDPEFRASLSEVRLYAKPAGGTWKLQEQGPPNMTRFQCRVPQDGEYWYTLVTVDRTGRPSIADVNLEPPSQRVIVDSAAPVIQVQAGNALDGNLCLRCTVVDANPDQATLRAVCKTDQGEIPLEALPNQPGCFRVKGPEMLRFPVIVSATDLAKNTGTKEVSLRDMIGSTLTPTPNPAPPTAPTPITTPNEVAPAGTRPDWKGPGPAPLASNESPLQRTEAHVPPRQEGPAGQTASSRVELPPPPTNPPALNPQPITTPPVNPPLAALDPTRLGVTTNAAPRSNVPHQLINTTHAAIEYRIDQVGLSGVGRVDVYMTPDNGQSWHRLGEDTDKKSPAEINLPGDGLYGIRIVVSNGNGFGGKAPIRGDAPHCTVEVDSTNPFVQFRSADLVPSTGHVELRWNATDKNLATESVTLSYRTRTDGPWQPIAKNVKNEGLYRWAFPRDGGGQFFFKIEVTDQAGNLSLDVSRQPVVIDMSEPRATVVGVSGSGVPPRPALGGN